MPEPAAFSSRCCSTRSCSGCWRHLFGRELVLSKRAGTVIAYGILFAFVAGLAGYAYWLMSWDVAL